MRFNGKKEYVLQNENSSWESISSFPYSDSQNPSVDSPLEGKSAEYELIEGQLREWMFGRMDNWPNIQYTFSQIDIYPKGTNRQIEPNKRIYIGSYEFMVENNDCCWNKFC